MMPTDFRDAIQASRQEEWGVAANLWHSLSDQHPDNPEPALEWSLASQNIADFTAVIQACDRVLSHIPDHRTALLRRANAVERAAPPATAARAWRSVSRLLPEDPLPHVRLSRVLRRAGRKRAASLAALGAWRRDGSNSDAAALAMSCLDPDEDCLTLGALWRDRLLRQRSNPPLRSDRGQVAPPLSLPPRRLIQALERAGAMDLLASLCDALVAVTPGDPGTHRLLAKAHETLGNLERAADHLAILMEHDPSPPAARMALVRFHERHRNWIRAAEYLTPLTQGPDADADMALRRIDRLGRGGLDDAATAASRDACARWPRQSDVWVRHLRAARKRGNLAEMEHAMAQGLAHHPAHETLLVARARYFWGERRWEESLAIWRTLAEDTGDIDALVYAGRCLVNLDRFAEAAVHFTEAATLDPENADALARLFRAQRRLGRFDAAEQAVLRWLALRQNQAAPWLALVDLLVRMGRDDEAERRRREAEHHLPETPDMLVALAGLARRTGQWAEEDTLLHRALDQGGTLAVVRHHLTGGGIGTAHELLRKIEEAGDLSSATRRERETLDGILALLDPQGALSLEEKDALRLPDAALSALGKLAAETPTMAGGRGLVLVARSLGAGGAERQVSVTLRGLRAKGVGPLHLVTATMDPERGRDFYAPLLADLSVTLHHPEEPVEAGGEPLSLPDRVEALLGLCSPSMAREIRAHLRLFQTIRPALVHVWQDALNITAGLAAQLAGVPRVILTARTLPPLHPKAMRRSVRHLREGYRAVLSHPTTHFCVNSHAGAAAYGSWLDHPRDRISVIHNGLDRTWLDIQTTGEGEGESPPPPAIPAGAPVVGTVFRFVWQKNPALWLRVAEHVAAQRTDCHFLLVGDGPGRGDFSEAVARVGLTDRVHLVGRVSSVTPWYARMTLFLMTSVVEGLPNAVMEAQANGLPVVATAAGGTAEIIEQGRTGWSVPLPEDPSGEDLDPALETIAKTLADRILWCLGHPDWIAEAARLAPDRMDTVFSVAAMVDRTLALYGSTELPLTQLDRGSCVE